MKNLSFISLFILSLFLVSCSGGDESASENVESAADKAGAMVESAGDSMADTMDAAADKAGEMMDSAGEAMGDAMDATREKAGEMMDSAEESMNDAKEDMSKSLENWQNN